MLMSNEIIVTITNRYYSDEYRVLYHDVGRPSFNKFYHFEDAYEDAMAHADWDTNKIKIEVYPVIVQDVIKKFRKEAVKRKAEANRKKDYELYLQLEKRFKNPTDFDGALL